MCSHFVLPAEICDPENNWLIWIASDILLSLFLSFATILLFPVYHLLLMLVQLPYVKVNLLFGSVVVQVTRR
jgi:hypothetical protein